MAASEDDLLGVWPKVAACRRADARANAMIDTRVQLHDEDLVKRIAGALLFRLENDLRAVGREITLAGADEVVRHLANVPEVDGFELLPVSRLGGKSKACQDGQHSHLLDCKSLDARRRPVHHYRRKPFGQ